MRINRIGSQNFRSFGKNNITLKLNTLNIIVGENNTGKSNVLKMIMKVIKSLKYDESFKKEDFFEEKDNSTVIITIELSFDTEDLNELINYLGLQVKTDEFNQVFGSKIEIIIKCEKCEIEKCIKFGNYKLLSHEKPALWISGHWSDQDVAGIETKSITWGEVLNDFENHGGTLENRFANYKNRAQSFCIEMYNDIFKKIGEILEKNIIFFKEFRERPDETDPSYTISPKNLADELIGLKNGDANDKKKFGLIKKEFSELFPDLLLETSSKNGNKIVLQRKNKEHYEISHYSIGAGIFEIIKFLTYLIGKEKKVLLIDEPELHLHPHMQRKLSKIIKDFSNKKNQILYVTHSPIFIDLSNPEDIKVISNHDGMTCVSEISPIPDDVKKTLTRIIDNDGKEFLFAKKVILVEGDTEMGAIPNIFNKLKMDLDTLGITLIPCVTNFSPFIKILKSIGIPFHVIADRDTLMNIHDSIKINGKKVKTSIVIAQLENLGFLKQEEKMRINQIEKQVYSKEVKNEGSICVYNDDLFNDLQKIAKGYNFHILTDDFEGVYRSNGCKNEMDKAKKIFRKSKVLAAKIYSDKCSVPKELSDIMKKIVK